MRNEFVPFKKNYDFGYVFGTILGDGWISGNKIGLTVTDKDFSEEFKRCLSKIYPYKIYRKEIKPRGISKKIGYNIMAYSKDYVKFFKDIKISEIMISSNEVKKGFLRGFFDSEGCASISNLNNRKLISRGISLYQKDKRLLINVGIMLNEKGIKFGLMSIIGSGFKKDEIYWVIRITGRKNFILFKKTIGFSIKRKKEKVNLIISSYITSMVCEICKKKVIFRGKFENRKRCNKCGKEYNKQYHRHYYRELYRTNNPKVKIQSVLKPTNLIKK